MKNYTTIRRTAGYSTVDNLTRAVKPNFSRGEVVRWLESQDVYTLHRPTVGNQFFFWFTKFHESQFSVDFNIFFFKLKLFKFQRGLSGWIL